MCPRCQSELVPAVPIPSDEGIALESFDLPSEENLAPPVDWLAQEETSQRLRAIKQKLHGPYRQEMPVAVSARPSRPWAESPAPLFGAAGAPLQGVMHPAAVGPTVSQKTTRTSWSLSLLLFGGVMSFCTGVGLLVWSTAFQLPQLRQQGMTLTLGAEGLLIVCLTWMAVRLWRNSRHVNRQLHSVGQQLDQIKQATGTLAGSQTSSSQHFYHHANQAVSPQMLVANLQGQVDQLAARVGG